MSSRLSSRVGDYPPSHARWLSGLEESNQIEIATAAVAQRLSVRDVEALAKEQRTRRPGIPVHVTTPGRARGGKDPDIRRLENELSARLGVSVVIDHRRAGGGTLRVRYPDLDVLDDLLERLGHRPDTLAERP